MKKYLKRILLFVLCCSTCICVLDIKADAAQRIFYKNMGSVGGQMIRHDTRYKYVYDTNDVKETTTYSSFEEYLGKVENKTGKKKECQNSFAVTKTTTYSFGASIPSAMIMDILGVSANVQKSSSYTFTQTVREELPRYSSVKCYLKYEIVKRTCKVKRIYQMTDVRGVWKDQNTSYVTISRESKVPVLVTR